MSVFGIFISPTEYKYKKLLKEKPQELLHTLDKQVITNYVLPTVRDEILNKEVTICTDNEKQAMLHLFEPFFSFKFDDDEYGIIILGDDHDLLKLDKAVAYMYSLDSSEFLPIVDSEGNYDGKWYSNELVTITPDVPFRKIKLTDLLRCGIQVFWIDSMDTLKQIDNEMNSGKVNDGKAKLDYLINQTNWKSDKIMYMNKYKNICPAIQTDDGFEIDYKKQGRGRPKSDD